MEITEAPVEEVSTAAEAPVEEAPVEEADVEEAPAEEAPAEEEEDSGMITKFPDDEEGE